MNGDVRGHRGSAFVRATSCFSEPQESALQFVLDGDNAQLTTLLADVCPIGDNDDENSNSVVESGASKYPLPDDHWINRPCGRELQQKFSTLLEIALHQGSAEVVGTLLAAGARADMYNADMRRAPIHVAARYVQPCLCF